MASAAGRGATYLRIRGVYHFERLEFAAAEQRLREAIALLPEPGDERPGASVLAHAVCLYDLANAVREQGRYQEARGLYQQARTYFEEVFGRGHPDIVNLALDQAILDRLSGAVGRARVGIEEVLATASRPGHWYLPIKAEAHLQLAELQRDAGERDSAMVNGQAGQRIMEAIYPGGHRKLADAHLRVGAIAYRQCRYEFALAEYQAAHGIMGQTLGAGQVDTALVGLNMAEAALAQGQLDQAERQLEGSLPALHGLLEQGSVAAFVASVQGRLEARRGRHPFARAQLEHAVREFDKLEATSPGLMQVERADALFALARELATQRPVALERARELATQAHAVYREQEQSGDGGCDPTVATRAFLKQKKLSSVR